MKLLVTGAGGVLGTAIVHHFARLGWGVYGIGRSFPTAQPAPNVEWRRLELPDPALATLLRAQQPNLIVHAAGSASVARSMEEPLYDLEQSVLVWANVLNAIRQSAVTSRVILLSSAAVYGNPHYLPIDENHPTNPVSPYGYHKRMCEEVADYYVRLYGLPICSARIFSAYGPGLRRQVVWAICQQAIVGNSINLSGTGQESRDFIHTSDVAQAIARLATHGNFDGGVYNVASGVATTIRTLAEKIVTLLDKPLPINFNGQTRSGDPLHWQADVTQLAALGFQGQTSLEQGLHNYLRWALQPAAEAPTSRLPIL